MVSRSQPQRKSDDSIPRIAYRPNPRASARMGERGVMDDSHSPCALTFVGKHKLEIWTIVESAACQLAGFAQIVSPQPTIVNLIVRTKHPQRLPMPLRR